MAALQYADIFSNILIELYGQSQVSVDLYNSNSDIQIVNGKNLKIPKLSVSGYKDHTRGSLGFNIGSYSNEYETKTLDHDRDIEFVIDPVDVDETNLVVTIANIQKRFETTQAIPEADCYTFSKLYSEAKRVGAKVKTTALTTANVLSDFDDNLEAMTDAGVPLDRVILYCTPAYLKLLKNAEGIQRTLEVSGAKGIDRRVHSIDDIGMIKEVPSARFKSKYNFTSGCTADVSAVQMDYMLIDPECQVSRNKYSFITVFEPGTDSRTADNYLYQNRKLNGTFAIDELMKEGCIIHAAAE
ncbi:capsid protein [Eubacterium sp. LMAG:50]|uniref:capsid protein n=1 Tax=Eubacterium sp. LMAG:50 TaxID=1969563 RepID=UPI0025BDDC60|nr:capsid protein [Eubacterium sp. LMAG:50]